MSTETMLKKKLPFILQEVKTRCFIAGYAARASDEEALGLLLSKYLEWSGNRILKACSFALEDANFHDEAAKVDELITA